MKLDYLLNAAVVRMQSSTSSYVLFVYLRVQPWESTPSAQQLIPSSAQQQAVAELLAPHSQAAASELTALCQLVATTSWTIGWPQCF
jgi:hypothetical protein